MLPAVVLLDRREPERAPRRGNGVSGLEFVASLARSLVWPAIVLVAVLVFRSTIRSALAGQIKRWQAGLGGVEIEYWEQTAEKARDQLPPDAEEQAVQLFGGGLVGELTPVAEAAPQAAVMEAFARIERELRRITQGLEPAENLKRSGWEYVNSQWSRVGTGRSARRL
jgi:hypothetical protein